MSEQPEKLDLRSMDISEEKKQELLKLFPEIRTEGDKIDFNRLKLALGDMVDSGKERYGMNWPGKADCFRAIQTPSTGTLLPCPEESVDFDSTENLILEGDNLEILKLLQKSYLGKVKMIYIDPPYNTGNDFVYPDDFSDNMKNYLQYTGQADSEGRKFGTNSDTDGRFHSNWMNMMYPRLYLARNLLREDGVIFISIDDNEVSNLKQICDEIFGEENFLGLFVINSSPSAIDYGHIAKMHDYVIFYSKNISETDTYQLPEKEKIFKYTDENGPFNLYPLYNGNVAFNPKTRPNLYYPFYLNPNKNSSDEFYEISLEKKEGWIEVFPVISKKDNIQRVWRWGKEKSNKNLNNEIVGYMTLEGEYRVVQKTRHTSKVIRSLQLDKDISSRRGTSEFEALFKKKLFSFPKSIELLKRFLTISLDDNDIFLDFFAGSGTSGQSIIELNNNDGGNRKYILVQIPEPCEEDSEAFKAGYCTIAEITKERVRRVIKKLNDEDAGKLPLDGPQDRGFRVFKLAPSNFTPWDGQAAKDAPALEEQLALHINHIHTGRSQDDILYELLLKSGYSLTTPVEKLILEGKTVYQIAGGEMLICLEKELTMELIRAMAALHPQRVICLDAGFDENDQLKANAVQIFRTAEVPSFKTV